MSLQGLSIVEWERHLAGWLSPSRFVVVAVAAVPFLALTFSYCRGLYRLYWHPLSKFPGPKEATKSDLWLYHQDLTPFPEDTFEDLHRQYGEFIVILG